VILYSGTATGRDFLALELFDGQVRYVYDVGGGARTLRANLRHGVTDNRWHTVAIVRSTLSQVTTAATLLLSAGKVPELYSGHGTLWNFRNFTFCVAG